MSKTRSNKKIPELVSSFENILVCNNNQLRPFIEIFVFEPENITQKNLGTLIGIFEISDTSEDSSYVVNYLSSVIRKEYFSKPKRAPIESFEAALHRANLALSKIAEHGNVRWIGKLNALIAVIEKNNLHLSQAGTASALLLRARGLTDISEGLSSDEAPHPLKTFVNVSSGRLENQDKLLITTSSIFEIFSLEEIKKSALRFAGEKFVQFLKTALGNELEKAAVLIVDIQEKLEPVQTVSPARSKSINAFSQAAFFKEPAPRHDLAPTEDAVAGRENVSLEMNEEIHKEIRLGQKEFADEKNGHIYIKETLEESLQPPRKPPVDYAAIFNRQLGAAHTQLKRISQGSGLLLLNAARKISVPKIRLPKFKLPKIDVRPKSRPTAEPLPVKKPEVPTAKISFLAKLEEAKKAKGLSPVSDQTQDSEPVERVFAAPAKKSDKNFTELALASLGSFGKKLKHLASTLTPDFSKIRQIVARLDYQQRIYAFTIILLIFVVPWVGLKISAYIQKKNAKPAAPVVEVIVPLAQDKNVSRLENLNSVFSDTSIATVINLNDKFFAVSQSQIVDLETKSATPIPGDFGQLKLATGMDDLNLIFLMNASGKTISFSPVPKKFQDNNLSIPAGANISAAGTYLTYLYLIDATSSQILRYPRAEGGFGAGASWLKDSVDLSQATGMALSDNIFVVENGSILKFFKGKKQDFTIETTATPIAPFKIFTKPDSQNIFVLDKQNSRVIKLDLNGQIIAQFFNAEIGNATNFAIDEKTNTAFISTSGEIKSFPLN